jgi:hypothetical protein
LKAIWKRQSELLKQRFLLGAGFGDAAQADLPAVSSGQDIVDPLTDGFGSIGARRLSRCFKVTLIWLRGVYLPDTGAVKVLGTGS